MRKPPQLWHGVAWKGLSQREHVPSTLVSSMRVTRVSALPHRTQNASWVFIVLVYSRFPAMFPLLWLNCRWSSRRWPYLASGMPGATRSARDPAQGAHRAALPLAHRSLPTARPALLLLGCGVLRVRRGVVRGGIHLEDKP